MKYLLDTNVISELQKPNCNPKVKCFTDEIPFENLFLSVISIGEICQGIEKLPPGEKKRNLSVWLYSVLPAHFQGRIVSLDLWCMLTWGRLSADTKRTLPLMDSLLAAVALTNNMTLITRNAKDFAGISGICLLNPWE